MDLNLNDAILSDELDVEITNVVMPSTPLDELSAIQAEILQRSQEEVRKLIK